jgi:TonB family protein
LRAALETPAGVSEELVATVDVLLAADGTLSHARIAESSGSAEFDHAVLVAIGRTRMRARPDGKSEVVTIPFSTHRETPR